jgi:hypothetical protein
VRHHLSGKMNEELHLGLAGFSLSVEGRMRTFRKVGSKRVDSTSYGE